MTAHAPQPKGDEGICKRCGKCCCFKATLPDGAKVITPLHCIHLDRATRSCKVYDRRRDVAPSCMGWKQALEACFLPDGCAYVKRYGWEGYRCKGISVPWEWWGDHREWLRSLALTFGYSRREFEALIEDCEAGRWG